MIELLNGLGDVDDGVECRLNQLSFDALISIVRSLYGNHIASQIESNFDQREDGSMVCVVEDLGDVLGGFIK